MELIEKIVYTVTRIQSILLGFLFAFGFLPLGCYTLPVVEPDKEFYKLSEDFSSADTTLSVSVIEGKVILFSGGGTREMPYPGGYIITDLHWLTNITFPVNRIYLDVFRNPTWLNYRVRVTGKLRKETLTGTPSNYTYSIIRMKIDTLEIID
jgi:hypothetical protein